MKSEKKNPLIINFINNLWYRGSPNIFTHGPVCCHPKPKLIRTSTYGMLINVYIFTSRDHFITSIAIFT